MKQFFTFAAITVLSSSFALLVNMDEIVNAMKAGNASQMAKYFDNTIEISMPDKSNNYSKTQAEIILKDFFGNNPVKNFSILHKGENAGSQYCIGMLATKNGEFRTTIFVKQKGSAQLLQEIRFENK